MATHDIWLRELAAASKGPVTLPPATRGLAWSEPVELAGDWTGATLEGTVSIDPDAPAPMANFAVTGPVLVDGVSTWMISLAAGTGENSTGALGPDSDQDGVERFPFMLRLTPAGGVAETLLGGLLPVIGRA